MEKTEPYNNWSTFRRLALGQGVWFIMHHDKQSHTTEYGKAKYVKPWQTALVLFYPKKLAFAYIIFRFLLTLQAKAYKGGLMILFAWNLISTKHFRVFGWKKSVRKNYQSNQIN